MAGQPRHAAAEAPVARPARYDHAIELVLAHLLAQCRIAPGIFSLRELLIDGVAIKRRVVHVAERAVLVEAIAHLLPGEGTGRQRHGHIHFTQSLQFPIATRPPAAATASSASCLLKTCSTVGLCALSRSPTETS